MERLDLGIFVAASPDEVYLAWVDGDRHAAMSGGGASSDPRVGGRFTAWDGYIQGEHVALEPGRRVVQRWRTAEFPPDAPDSLLELTLEAVPGGTRVTLVHTEIPDGQAARYDEGWVKFYFEPMRAFFGG